MTQPLEGFTVVSLEQAVAAPLATRDLADLADLGARVGVALVAVLSSDAASPTKPSSTDPHQEGTPCCPDAPPWSPAPHEASDRASTAPSPRTARRS